jgi:hypothetical protein
MSRTLHHSLNHGTPPAGEGCKNRACGYEFWGRRPMSRHHGVSPGKGVKKITHSKERAEAKTQLHKELHDD